MEPALYTFQKDAVLAIINKLEAFNGCILADSVGLGKTFTALAVIKYYENRNRSVLVLCPKPNNTSNIAVLIATDCVSEGQNLQDCDYCINTMTSIGTRCGLSSASGVLIVSAVATQSWQFYMVYSPEICKSVISQFENRQSLVLEFLDLEQSLAYTESDLRSAIIANLQQFLLEIGKGFLFEARQNRFAFDEKSFFVDLVFYNRLLQCYVLIDLKTGGSNIRTWGKCMSTISTAM